MNNDKIYTIEIRGAKSKDEAARITKVANKTQKSVHRARFTNQQSNINTNLKKTMKNIFIQERIHVKTLDGQSIFGSLNIGDLKKTNRTHDGLPVYKMGCGLLVTCSEEMLARIVERLEFLRRSEKIRKTLSL